ncbi:MAG: hypothetical protein P8Z42_03160 [Anaerolineales bacterium]
MPAVKELNFKFRFVRNKNPIGVFAKNAIATDKVLILDQEPIDYADIRDSNCRDQRLAFTLSPGASVGEKTRDSLHEENLLVLEVSRVKGTELEKHIARVSSAIQTEQHRQELIEAGQADRFHSVVCSNCQATIDLSDFNRTSYVYCRYCESLIKYSGGIVTPGDSYRICDECGMFDRVRGYTLLHFYFLIVVYGYSARRIHVCDNCAVRMAKGALLRNLLFLFGVPSAIYMWVKAVTGRDKSLQALARANALARKGKFKEADEIYVQFSGAYPEHPAILRNRSLGHLYGNNINAAMTLLSRSLKSCNNYLPSLLLARRLKQVASRVGGQKHA